MTLNKRTFDLLRKEYYVYDIQTSFESNNVDVTISMSVAGIEKMIGDLFDPERESADSPIFSVSSMEICNEKAVYVAKYPMDKYPFEVIAKYGEKLRKSLEAEGCKVILMPEAIDVSILTVEQLTQMRDDLTKLIESLDYNSAMGFNK